MAELNMALPLISNKSFIYSRVKHLPGKGRLSYRALCYVAFVANR